MRKTTYYKALADFPAENLYARMDWLKEGRKKNPTKNSLPGKVIIQN